MAQPKILQLGMRDRVFAGVQLAGLISTWLIMYLPMCLLACAYALRDSLARRV